MDRQNEGVLRFLTDLNWLRLFCIVSIFLMHTGLSFSYIPQLFDHWYFQSRQANLLLTGFCSFANSACMPLFFLMSGSFARLKYNEGKTEYFYHRIRKWLWLFVLAWPITAIGVIGAHAWVIEQSLDYCSLIFPSGTSTRSAAILPMNFFHLWFLVVLIFCEGVMLVMRNRHLQNLGMGVLPGILVIQVLVMYSQGRGYLLTPVLLGAKTSLTILVYFGWYLLGYANAVADWVKHLGRLKHRWLWGGLGVCLYFTAKYFLLLYDFQAMAVGFQLGLLLCDALLPMSVLLLWFDLMGSSFFHGLLRQHVGLNQVKDGVIRYGLWIYLIQIPLIFLLLSIGKKNNLGNLFILGLKPLPELSESSAAILHWLVLSVATIVCVGLSFQLSTAFKKLVSGTSK